MNPLIQGLMKAEAYEHPITSFELLETHISWVILTGEYAYKLKKPVNLGFVDFSTIERRRFFCEEEIRLNRRLAPDLYLGVRPIYGTVEHPTFRPHGEPIEFAVQMQQFDQASLLPAVLQRGELKADQIDKLAQTIARFHADAAVADPDSPFGTPEAIGQAAFDNFQALSAEGDKNERIQSLNSWTEAEFIRRHDWFQERHSNRRIRECHGDMHLGNMVLQHGTIEIFDCLEFNPTLSWIDVIGEIAFLVMDLQERGRPDLAFRVLNRWLEQTGDFNGLVGLRWYVVYRAIVRAKVAALRLQQAELPEAERIQKRDEFQKYLGMADSWTKSDRPAVIIMHGLSGSGKSHVAEWICDHFSMIQIRSDVERKRCFGLWGTSPAERLEGELYSATTTAKLYRDVLADQVRYAVQSGLSVVVDATFLLSWQRTFFRELASQLNAPILIVRVEARPETIRRRLRARKESAIDPSDATAEVMERQALTREPLTAEEEQISLLVDTDSPIWSSDLKQSLRSRLADTN